MRKTALVTGSAGFVGRHMVLELEERGYQVYGYDLVESIFSAGADVVDLFRGAMTEHEPTVFDLIVHCAFHVGGRAAIDGINTHFLKNLQLDSAMFEWAVRTKQRHVLYFSSSAAYPISLQGKHDHLAGIADRFEEPESFNTYRLQEDDINPHHPFGTEPDANYGWAKLTGERMAEDARNNDLQVSVVRPFSGYGSDQSLDYPFPSIVRRAVQGDLTVWGPPGQARDWVHIDDVCKGALAVVESGTTDPVNLCTGIGTEMGELAIMIAHAAHLHDSFTYPGVMGDPVYLTDKPTGVHYRVGDPTRMLKYYTPQVTLEEGIRRALSA